eukprot:TRINITY_DN38308_c0_g1_i1.p1 TRINITY_DN38308_c0_g1~~TRINITY_DN38308_c0_g1_i1.p1  ORF type:complete len:260 (-),score=17.53 TRINITY_DN38308_c0_g1_i1:318-1097(-)
MHLLFRAAWNSVLHTNRATALFSKSKSSISSALDASTSKFPLRSRRTALNARADIFTIDGCLTKDECERLIGLAERIGFQQAAVDLRQKRSAGSEDVSIMLPHIRLNERIVIDDEDFASAMFLRCSLHFPSRFRTLLLHSFSKRVRLYKHAPGQHFAPHADGSFVDEDTGTQSVFTFLLYLNNVADGGRTCFFSGFVDSSPRSSDDMFKEKNLLLSSIAPVEPSSGRALAFYHKHIHKGEEVRSGVKYVIRLDVMYRRV